MKVLLNKKPAAKKPAAKTTPAKKPAAKTTAVKSKKRGVNFNEALAVVRIAKAHEVKSTRTTFTEKQPAAVRVAKAHEIIAAKTKAAVAESDKAAGKPQAKLGWKAGEVLHNEDGPSELGPLSDAIETLGAKRRAIKAEQDTPRIECRLIVGDLSLPVDASNLERTLGAGRWGRESFVDAWPDAAWTGLLAYLGLPAFPLDREAATQPVKRLVQKLWYEAIKGGVPEERKEVMDTRDKERAKEYSAVFNGVDGSTGIKAKVEGKAARAKTSFAKARGGETKYAPTAALKALKTAPGGQAGILHLAFKNAKWAAMSTSEAAEAMVKAGLKTATKPERIAGFYLCQWVKADKGWLERVILPGEAAK